MKVTIKSTFGIVLFEFEKENNTIKETLEEAVKKCANLDGANLGGFGKLRNYSDVLVVGNIGSRNGYTTMFRTDKGVFVQCGCFKGSLDDFEKKVKETHQGNNHELDYLAMIEFAKVKLC